MAKENYKADEVKSVIMAMNNDGKVNVEIARALNKKGLYTKTGKEWTSGNVSLVSIKDLGLPRKKNTSRGEAGSTGGYSNLNGHAYGPRKPRKGAPVTATYNDMEDVMTSNLSPKLKLKLIARLAKDIE